MMKRTICFIDDDVNELTRFKDAMKRVYKVITGSSYEECSDKLKKHKLKKPDLWVLDLYFPTGSATNTPKHRSEMDQRYHKLVESIRKFRAFLVDIGQGPSGGLENLEKCKKDRVPVLFLTRKGTLDDAVECIDKGAERVLRKPMAPRGTKAENMSTGVLDKAMSNDAGKLRGYFDDAISKNSHLNRYKYIYVLLIGALFGALFGKLIGVFVDYVFSLLTKFFT